MFELDPAIAKWRREMAAMGIKTRGVLDELESHLREDIEGQIRSGAEPERAFAAAVLRMGEAARLKEEFGKVQDLKRRNRLRAVSVFAGAGVAYAAIFVMWFILWRQGKFEFTRMDFLLVLGSMAATIALGFVGRSAAKFLPIVIDERLQAAAIVVVIFLGAVSLRVLWSFLNLDNLIHVQIVLLWTMSPLLGFGYCSGTWCERCAAARKQMNPAIA